MLNKVLGWILVVMIAWVGVSVFTPLAFGAEAQNNQGGDRLATLKAPSANFEISLYPKPDSKLDRLGFGLSGDEVTVLEQMSSNKRFSWYRVRFDNPPYVEGWMEGKYLMFINQDNVAKPSISDKNRYLGNHASPTNSQANQQQGNQRQYQRYSRN